MRQGGFQERHCGAFKEKRREMVRELIREELRTMIPEYLGQKPQEPERIPQEPAQSARRVLHPRVTCDGCQGPVYGIRYKCYTCHDFDYCERCEATIEHSHPFIKIRTPDSFQNMTVHLDSLIDAGSAFGFGGNSARGPCPFNFFGRQNTTQAPQQQPASEPRTAHRDVDDDSLLSRFCSMQQQPQQPEQPQQVSADSKPTSAQAGPNEIEKALISNLYANFGEIMEQKVLLDVIREKKFTQIDELVNWTFDNLN